VIDVIKLDSQTVSYSQVDFYSHNRKKISTLLCLEPKWLGAKFAEGDKEVASSRVSEYQ
jgi:hypothetical protein